MGRVFARGSMLHLEYVDASGKQKRKSSGLRVGMEAEATKLLREMETIVKTRSRSTVVLATGETLRSFADKWVEGREGRVRSVADEESRLRLHVLPTMGDMLLAEIKPRPRQVVVIGWQSHVHQTRWSASGFSGNTGCPMHHYGVGYGTDDETTENLPKSARSPVFQWWRLLIKEPWKNFR